MRISGLSDIGARRARNEDAMDWDGALGVAMVADGMGGHPAGHIASRIAAETVMARLRADREAPLDDAIEQAHRGVLRYGDDHPDCAGLGSTVVVARVDGAALTMAHVGDSRAYLLRDGRLRALTADHNAARAAVAGGWMTPAEARHSPERHMLDRAVGLEGRCHVERSHIELQTDDRLLLCTDGLTGEIGDDTIEAVLNGHLDSSEAACRALVEAALDAGGSDNVTVVLATY